MKDTLRLLSDEKVIELYQSQVESASTLLDFEYVRAIKAEINRRWWISLH